MVVDELLNGLDRCCAQFLVHLLARLLDLLKVVQADVLIAVSLEDVTRNLTLFKTRRVDEVAVLTACAAVRSVVVAAGDGTEVAGLYQLVGLQHGLLCVHLVKLGHLDLSLLINLLEFDYLLVGKRY